MCADYAVVVDISILTLFIAAPSKKQMYLFFVVSRTRLTLVAVQETRQAPARKSNQLGAAALFSFLLGCVSQDTTAVPMMQRLPWERVG